MTLKDKPSEIFGIILLTPEELETGAGACTETVEIGYFMRFFNFCAFCIYIRGGAGIIPGDLGVFILPSSSARKRYSGGCTRLAESFSTNYCITQN